MLTVNEIAFTGYPVTEIKRARAFYEGLLNLKASATFEHDGKSWIEYDIGAGTLAISNMSPDQWKPSSQGPVSVLEVDDFDAAVAVLKDAGVPFSVEPMDSGVCRMAIVSDPDGNSLGVHKRKAS